MSARERCHQAVCHGLAGNHLARDPQQRLLNPQVRQRSRLVRGLAGVLQTVDAAKRENGDYRLYSDYAHVSAHGTKLVKALFSKQIEAMGYKGDVVR